MSGCCGEYKCRRSKPYKIRISPFSGRWTLITDYAIGYSPSPDRLPTLVAHAKHDIHDELTAALLDAGWIPPKEDAK